MMQLRLTAHFHAHLSSACDAELASEKGEEGPQADVNMWSLPVDIVKDAGVQRAAWRAHVETIYDRLLDLRPDLTIVSLGFDALEYDVNVVPSCAGKLRIDDYTWAMKRLKSAGGKLLIVMEVSHER